MSIAFITDVEQPPTHGRHYKSPKTQAAPAAIPTKQQGINSSDMLSSSRNSLITCFHFTNGPLVPPTRQSRSPYQCPRSIMYSFGIGTCRRVMLPAAGDELPQSLWNCPWPRASFPMTDPDCNLDVIQPTEGGLAFKNLTRVYKLDIPHELNHRSEPTS